MKFNGRVGGSPYFPKIPFVVISGISRFSFFSLFFSPPGCEKLQVCDLLGKKKKSFSMSFSKRNRGGNSENPRRRLQGGEFWVFAGFWDALIHENLVSKSPLIANLGSSPQKIPSKIRFRKTKNKNPKKQTKKN